LTSAIPDILSRIVERKRAELREAGLREAGLREAGLREAGLRENAARLAEWEERAERSVMRRRPFAAALRRDKPAVIAEMKKASPSRGLLTSEYDPRRTALAYEAGGAAALSVLTDRDFFQGDLEHLEAARAAVGVPVLRKDFTISEAQILEAAAHGADAVLLIAAILSDRELRLFREYAAQFLLAALVEVHDEVELQRAVNSGAAIIGVNNRDLRTFEVRLETSLRLAAKMPANTIRVSESGIKDASHVRMLSEVGFDAFLVGEHLMSAEDPAAALKALRCS
jgi:indole-3-glycerol phosphate synthase